MKTQSALIKDTLQLFAVCESTNTAISYSLAQKMKLPISWGWDYWLVIHRGKLIKFGKYKSARRYVVSHRNQEEFLNFQGKNIGYPLRTIREPVGQGGI